MKQAWLVTVPDTLLLRVALGLRVLDRLPVHVIDGVTLGLFDGVAEAVVLWVPVPVPLMEELQVGVRVLGMVLPAGRFL